MERFIPLIVFGGIVALVGLAVAVSLLRERKRARALRAAAEAMGLSYAEKGDKALLASLEHFRLFTEGHSRRITHLVQGQANEIDLKIFDYRYTTGGGRNASAHRQSVLLLRTPHLSLPAFMLRPEGLLDKIGAVFGLRDMDLDDHPDFSKHYVLRGQDEEAVRRLFDADVLDWYGSRRGVSTEGAGQELVFYRADRRVPPEEFPALLEEGFALLTLFRSAPPRTA